MKFPGALLVCFALGCGNVSAQQLCVTPTQYGPLPIGRTVNLQARDIDWFGDCRQPLNGAVWTSSDSGVATVTATGRIQPLRVGTVTIQATLNQRRGSYSLHIVPAIHRLEIVPRDTSAAVGDTVTFRAIAYDVAGTIVPNVPFTFWDNQDNWRTDSVGPRWRRKALPDGYQIWSPLPAPGWVSARIVGDSAMARLIIR
jgi:hypothetical protein